MTTSSTMNEFIYGIIKLHNQLMSAKDPFEARAICNKGFEDACHLKSYWDGLRLQADWACDAIIP